MPMNSDENRSVTELIEEFRSGDRDAAAYEIWRRYEGRILGMAERGIARDLQHRIQPDDILITVMRVLLKGVGESGWKANSQGTLGALVRQITKNKIKNAAREYRTDKRDVRREGPEADDSLPDPRVEQEARIALAETFQDIRDKLKSDVFEIILRLYDGQSIQEIANELGSSEKAVTLKRTEAQKQLKLWATKEFKDLMQ